MLAMMAYEFTKTVFCIAEASYAMTLLSSRVNRLGSGELASLEKSEYASLITSRKHAKLYLCKENANLASKLKDHRKQIWTIRSFKED